MFELLAAWKWGNYHGKGITSSESCPLEGEHHPPAKAHLLSVWRYQMDNEKMIKIRLVMSDFKPYSQKRNLEALLILYMILHTILPWPSEPNLPAVLFGRRKDWGLTSFKLLLTCSLLSQIRASCQLSKWSLRRSWQNNWMLALSPQCSVAPCITVWHSPHQLFSQHTITFEQQIHLNDNF